MKKIYIVYQQFYDLHGEKIQIGGVETYLLNICKLMQKKGYKPLIYQFSNLNFDKTYDDIQIIGTKVKVCKIKSATKKIIKIIEKVFDKDNDYLLFAAEHYVVPFKYKEKTVCIQHGIHWDVPNTQNYLINLVRSSIRSVLEYRRINYCNKVICVDYNFINWFRAVYKKFDYSKIKVIPNFHSLDNNVFDLKCIKKDAIKILFARRFVEYRGIIIFATAIKNLLQYNNYNVEIVFAGDGPCEKKVKKMLNGYDNIHFTKYSQQDSISFHKNFDIAVVPTIGSEGTSLSLLDAMYSGCAVITTNVGGLTNVIIDKYNGIIINPDSTELYEALLLLINDLDLRKKIIENSINTVKYGFSKENWEKKWLEIFK